MPLNSPKQKNRLLTCSRKSNNPKNCLWMKPSDKNPTPPKCLTPTTQSPSRSTGTNGGTRTSSSTLITKPQTQKNSQSLYHHQMSLGICILVMPWLLPFKILSSEERECKGMRLCICREPIMQVLPRKLLLRKNWWRRKTRPDMIWAERSFWKRFGSSNKLMETE